MLGVVRVLHALRMPERQLVWEFTSRLHQLVTQPLHQAQSSVLQQHGAAAAGSNGHMGMQVWLHVLGSRHWCCSSRLLLQQSQPVAQLPASAGAADRNAVAVW
jgi:hypothetical protein